MKKGFTLTELIGVIVLLAAIMLILVPVVDKQLKESKQQIYQKQIESIKLGAQNFYENLTTKLDKNESMKIYLSELKQTTDVERNVSNPITKTAFPNDMEIEIKNEDGIITYTVLEDTGSDDGIYDGNTPTITLNGDNITYVNLNDVSGYIDLGATASVNGKNVPVELISNQCDITEAGIYTYVYKAINNNRTVYSTRTVIVKDLEAPVIAFPETPLTISLSEVLTYNFLSDVVVTDNSGEAIVPTVETNFGSLIGPYTIKYIAKDSMGNETIKFRNVDVTN